MQFWKKIHQRSGYEKETFNQLAKANEAFSARAAMGAAVDHAVVGGVADPASSGLSKRSGESIPCFCGLHGVRRCIVGSVFCHGGGVRSDPAGREAKIRNAPKRVPRNDLGGMLFSF